jgi:hypothetical protein
MLSTLEYAELTDWPTEHFTPFVQQLQTEWNLICAKAEEHLARMVCPVIESASCMADLE